MKIFVFFLLLFFSCGPDVPKFDENRAFGHLLTQCDFGPRNPGSKGYYACLDFMVKEFEKYADEVILQEFSYKDPRIRKKTHELTNVIARFNPNAQFQTMISCHWDTRPVADMEDNREDRNQPIIGANDGASGVAVILELARILGENLPQIGVNLVMFDGEDMGIPGENET